LILVQCSGRIVIIRRRGNGRTPIHPGTILGDELKELDISARQLADIIGVPHNRLYQIIAGKRELTAIQPCV
jgi:plasmid maintenance system antidote protein VapI